MGAYSRWALIRGWALNRINTVIITEISNELNLNARQIVGGLTGELQYVQIVRACVLHKFNRPKGYSESTSKPI